MTVEEAAAMTIDDLARWLAADARSPAPTQMRLHAEVKERLAKGELSETFVDHWVAANERFAEVMIDEFKKTAEALQAMAEGKKSH